MKRARKHSRAMSGFTLIEVMIAVAIVSLSLAVVFGNSIFAAKESMHASRLNKAASLARCRMNEAEAYLTLKGFSENEQELEDPPDMGGEPCCRETEFECKVTVTPVKLPEATASTNAGDKLLQAAGDMSRGSSFSPNGGAVNQLGSAFANLGSTGSSGGTGSFSGAGAPALNKVIGDLLVSLYPTLKPLYESAIRKVVLKMSWKEGSREHSFEVVQYVAQPGRSFAPVGP